MRFVPSFAAWLATCRYRLSLAATPALKRFSTKTSEPVIGSRAHFDRNA